MLKSIKVSELDILEGNQGACLACGEIHHGIEPDARNYECEVCGENQVFGLEELLLMGKIELIDEDEELEEHDDE